MLQGLQKTGCVQKEKFRPFKDPLGSFGVIGVGGFVAGLIVSNPCLGRRNDPEPSGFPEQIVLGPDYTLVNLGNMLQITLEQFPAQIHGVLEPLDHSVPQELVMRIGIALLYPGFELFNGFFQRD